MSSKTVSVYNCSRQTIPVQVGTKDGDFYLTQQQIHLQPGKVVDLPRTHVLEEQLTNLQARGLVRVIDPKED